MIMNHKGKLWTLSHNSERLLKWNYITYKGINSSEFVSVNMIFATLFLNHDASLAAAGF